MEFSELIPLMFSDIENCNQTSFDSHLSEFAAILKETCISKINFLKCYDVCLTSSDDHYVLELLKVYKENPLYFKLLSGLLYTAIRKRNVRATHQLILDGTKNGTDDSFLCSDQHKALKEAIESNSYELVSMILYYGGYGHIFYNGLTPLIESMYMSRDVNIQELLIDYEDDFEPNFSSISPLFVALSEKSPLAFEIIKRGANLNFFYGSQNVFSCSLLSGVSPEIFQVIWKRFDYKVWEETFNTSVLLFFLSYVQWHHRPKKDLYVQYIKIIMENEEKLTLTIEHHNNSPFKSSDSLIYYMYRCCKQLNIPETTIQSYVFHLLSHGATLSTKDLNKIYYMSFDLDNNFFEMLLYMDIKSFDYVDKLLSPLYFRYNLNPDLFLYFDNICKNIDNSENRRDCFDQFCYLKQFFAFTDEQKNMIFSRCFNIDIDKGHYVRSYSFPSLTELARKKTREAIITRFNIRNSCQLLTHVNYLDISQHLKDIILFKVKIYSFP